MPTPSFDVVGLEAHPVNVPAADYYGIVALGENLIALALSGEIEQEAVIEIVDASTGTVLDNLAIEKGEECVIQRVKGLSLMPDGRMAFADVCERPGGLNNAVVTVYAYDHVRQTLESLGRLADEPAEMAWSSPTDVFYTAGTTLCETIFQRTPDGDGPVDIRVVVQGAEIPLGEDVLSSEDRCTQQGNAAVPAITGGRLAAFARRGLSGPDLLDLPWAIVVASGHDGHVVLDGVQYPGGLAWLTDSRLLFTGSMFGREGVWALDADGTNAAHVGDLLLAPFSLSPDRSQLFGLRPRPPSDPPRPVPIDVDVYRYDLSSA